MANTEKIPPYNVSKYFYDIHGFEDDRSIAKDHLIMVFYTVDCTFSVHHPKRHKIIIKRSKFEAFEELVLKNQVLKAKKRNSIVIHIADQMTMIRQNIDLAEAAKKENAAKLVQFERGLSEN